MCDIHPIPVLVTEHEPCVLKSGKNDSDYRNHLLTYSSGLATARATVSMTKSGLDKDSCASSTYTAMVQRTTEYYRNCDFSKWTWRGYRSKTEWKHRHCYQHTWQQSWLCKLHDVTLQSFAEQVKKIFWAWPCRELIGRDSQSWSWALLPLHNARASYTHNCAIESKKAPHDLLAY